MPGPPVPVSFRKVPMRYMITPLLAGLVFSVLCFGSAQAQIIHLDKENIDFGLMSQHESKDTQVIVTNKGGGILEISEVKADCGCTVPTLAKQTLSPGESTVIDINFNSKAFHGNITKMVHIYSNDPDAPEKTFFIQANVTTPLLIDPPSQRIGFSQHPVGTTHTKMVMFTATDAPELIIQAQKSRKNMFDISVINNYEGNSQISALVVTVPERMPAGKQRDIARVKTNIEGHDTVDIELAAWQVLALNTSLDKINYRYKSDFSKAIQVIPSMEGVKFKVTKVECDLPEISFTFENVLPNQQSTIRLEGSPIDKTDPRAIKKKGHITGTLIIHTDMKDLPTLEVPISYMIRM